MDIHLDSRIPNEWREKWNSEYKIGLKENATIKDILIILCSGDREPGKEETA